MSKARLPNQSQGENLSRKKADSKWFNVISIADNKFDARTNQVDHYEVRRRSYFSVLNGSLLRSYVSVTIYGAIWRKMATVNNRIFLYTAVNDRVFTKYGKNIYSSLMSSIDWT
jgi:hypothetical protein